MSKPIVYAVCGLPGTGKTHHAQRLARETGAFILSRDAIRTELFSAPDFSAEEKEAVFRVLIERAGRLLRAGEDVILEGMPFSRRCERDCVRLLARETHAEARLVHCICDESVALARIAAEKNHDAEDRNAQLYFEVRNRFESFGEDEERVEVRTDA